MMTANRVWMAALAVLLLASLAPAAEEKRVKVVMVGDSITYAGLTDAVQGPLNELTKGKVKWTMVNGGAPGASANGGKAFIGKLLAEHKPDVVTISFGLNDVSDHWSPANFKANMEAILEIINKQSPAPRIILFTTTPFDIARHFNGKNKAYNAEGGADVVLDTKFNGVTRQLAAEKQLPIVDLHRYFMTEKDWARRFIVPDGVHLTPEGYKFAGPYVAAAFNAWCAAEALKAPEAVELRDKALARLAKVSAKADDAKSPERRKKLLAELDEIWQACPYLPNQAAVWHAVYYAGFKPQPVAPQPEPPTPEPAKPGMPATPAKPKP
jgi:lysophospholipase L1-like esterase